LLENAEEENQFGYIWNYLSFVSKETVRIINDFNDLNEFFDIDYLKIKSISRLIRYLKDSRIYNKVLNYAGRLEVILIFKSYRAFFTITISDSEDWNVMLRIMKRWEIENYI